MGTENERFRSSKLAGKGPTNGQTREDLSPIKNKARPKKQLLYVIFESYVQKCLRHDF